MKDHSTSNYLLDDAPYTDNNIPRHDSSYVDDPAVLEIYSMLEEESKRNRRRKRRTSRATSDHKLDEYEKPRRKKRDEKRQSRRRNRRVKDWHDDMWHDV